MSSVVVRGSRRNPLRWAGVLLAGCLIALAPLEAETLRQEVEEVFPLAPGGRVSVTNLNGSLELSAWDRDEVLVEATKVVRAIGRWRAERALEELRIDFDHSADGLDVRTRFPRRRSGPLAWLLGRNVETRVSYRLRLPRQVQVRAETVNGNVTIDSVSGKIDAETTNGQIRIVEARGEASASTTNGDIRAELRELEEQSELRFSTTNGCITVYVPEGVRADVSASTVHGAVNTDFAALDQEVRGWRRKRLRGSLNGGGGQLRLESVNGSIQVRRLDGYTRPEVRP